jgi:hypothetical protein
MTTTKERYDIATTLPGRKVGEWLSFELGHDPTSAAAA